VESPQSAQSLVSSWSQLDSGTNCRLEELCLPDTEDLLPCQGDLAVNIPEPTITQVSDLENSQEIQEKFSPNNCDIKADEKEIIQEEEEEEEENENEEEKKDICDKENCTPEETEETEIKKKKNKKRRKHAKKKPQAPLVGEAESDLT